MAAMLRCLSSRRFWACKGLSDTAAPATKTELTRLTANATQRVRTVDSLFDIARKPPLDVGRNHEMIDQRRAQVGEQDG